MAYKVCLIVFNLKALEQLDVKGNPLSNVSRAVSQFLDGVGGKAT